MNIVFFGSSEFSMPSLKALSSLGHSLKAVVSVPSSKQGRGQRRKDTCVEGWAREHGFRVLTPEKAGDRSFAEDLKSLAPDMFVVASYGKILPSSVLSIPKRFCLNVHPSLLPRYRGAAPINWQIINGDTQCGITFFRMDEGMDSGDMVFQEVCPLDDHIGAEELSVKLAERSAAVLPEILEQIEKDKIKFVPQDTSKKTLAPKLKKEDGILSWNRSASDLHNLVRGLKPWPGAQTTFRNETVRIWNSYWEAARTSERPGAFLGFSKEECLRVATGDGVLLVGKLQREGKNVVTAREFANGVRLGPGEFFGQA